MTTEPKYPFFHWITGLVMCAFGVSGLVVGLLPGLAICGIKAL